MCARRYWQSMFARRLRFCFAAAILVGPLGTSAVTVIAFYWDGTGTSWNTASNWSILNNVTTPDHASPPRNVPGQDAYFGITTVNAAQIVNLDAAQAADGLIFTARARC